MRLVRVAHSRCAEYDCTTYVVAPEEWDEDRINAEVSKAQDAYLEEFGRAVAAKDGPAYPGHQPDYKNNRDKTVAEVMDAFAEKSRAFAAWQKVQREAQRTFESFLRERGFVALWDAETVEVECVWGHRHGQQLRYGEGETDTMPTPAKLAGIAVDDDDL